MQVRTRFAPSPTGNFHIGSARTAFYSWLYSKHHNGKFILRIDDSDFKRLKKNSIKNIINGMKWLGLNWDEGPFYQKERLNRYSVMIQKMIQSGNAYRCYCSKKRLKELRKKQIRYGEKPRYDGYCRNKKNKVKTENFVVRFKNPNSGSVIFKDKIRGIIEFKNIELDDLIICRSDKIPTYNFCVVIDDLDMKITHVIRGEEHINNTPKQINILKSLNAKIPIYAHLPIIFDSNKKKLSKRKGSTDLMYFRNEGYLPEALLNYIIRLGWSHGNQEIFNIKEMINLFSLEKVGKSSSIFDINKLLWINRQYINSLPVEYISYNLKKYAHEQNIKIKNDSKLLEIIKIFKNRCKTLKEILQSSYYMYQNFSLSNDDFLKNYFRSNFSIPFEKIYFKLKEIKNWNSKDIYKVIKFISLELNLDIKKIIMFIRLSITGQLESPSISQIMYVLGKNSSLYRIKKVICSIKKSYLN